MAYYYFLMAQLPAITSAAKPPLGYNEFLELASRYLSKRDNTVLASITLTPPRDDAITGSSVIDRWFARERVLRLSLAKLRAQKVNRMISLTTCETEALSLEVSVSQAARTAIALENPLEAERYLLRIRSQWIEELRGNHFFDSEAVFMYGLSLLLRERSECFTTESGQDAYESIYTQILGEEA